MLVKSRYKVSGKLEPFDERDNVQSRNALEPGSDEYKDFYKRHPELEDIDSRTRELSKKAVGHPLDFLFFLQQIGSLGRSGIENIVDGPVSQEKQVIPAERASEKIKGYAEFLGADLVRIGTLDPPFIYTHIGKTWHDPDRAWGAPIHLDHKYAVSIAIGLNPDLMKTGPVLSEAIEVMRVYNRLANIATTLAAYIRALGYPARAHIVSNYQVLCIPLAINAGMGELGRHGLMITKELGSSLKLAAVTTDLPLVTDLPVDIGVDEFCWDCRICAETCPAGAIPYGEKKIVRGVEKWAINPEACFRVWQETGTDCGVCVASCPWTKSGTLLHRMARSIATRKKKAGWWMSRAEKLIYGRFRPKPSPSWFEEPEPIWKQYKRLK